MKCLHTVQSNLVTFFKTTWHVEASGHLDFFRRAVWRHLIILSYLFFVWVLVIILYNCLLDHSNAFFLEHSSRICVLLNITRPSISMRLSNQWLRFTFWVNCPLSQYQPFLHWTKTTTFPEVLWPGFSCYEWIKKWKKGKKCFSVKF